MKTEELLAWLNGKLSESEKSVRARDQLEESWKTGSDKLWRDARKLHPSTAHLPIPTKAERLKESAAQGRIAKRCRFDVEMLKLAILIVSEIPVDAAHPIKTDL